jgi:hypothetical protein
MKIAKYLIFNFLIFVSTSNAFAGYSYPDFPTLESPDDIRAVELSLAKGMRLVKSSNCTANHVLDVNSNECYSKTDTLIDARKTIIQRNILELQTELDNLKSDH